MLETVSRLQDVEGLQAAFVQHLGNITKGILSVVRWARRPSTRAELVHAARCHAWVMVRQLTRRGVPWTSWPVLLGVRAARRSLRSDSLLPGKRSQGWKTVRRHKPSQDRHGSSAVTRAWTREELAAAAAPDGSGSVPAAAGIHLDWCAFLDNLDARELTVLGARAAGMAYPATGRLIGVSASRAQQVMEGVLRAWHRCLRCE